MGQSISRTHFTAGDRTCFDQRLEQSLEVLEALMRRPGFGIGPASIGAELELYLIDADGHPQPCAEQILAAAADPRLTPEINRYNLELNLTPGPLAGACLNKLEQDIVHSLVSLNQVAAKFDARARPIGILPTLRPRDLKQDMMSEDARFHTLSGVLRERRGEKFRIRINGQERLSAGSDSVVPEGANTSFQVHFRMPPERFVPIYNALQAITPLLVGLSANSPWLLGRQLWHETRIALFEQSIDGRSRKRRELAYPPRVGIGHGWLRHSALELFANAVRLYTPLLPECSERSPRERLAQPGTPELPELGLQMGTVYPWNRAVFDARDNGHVRVELRALPAGPTAIDMLANTAFALGLAETLSDSIESLIQAMPFATLERNLQIAAREGLSATLLWPSGSCQRPEPVALASLVEALLPMAASGLARYGVDDTDCERYLTCLQHRMAAGRSGADWQIRNVKAHERRGMSRAQALHAMLERYAHLSMSNAPVASWPLA